MGYLLIHVWQLCFLGDYLKLKNYLCEHDHHSFKTRCILKSSCDPRTEAVSVINLNSFFILYRTL